MLWNKILFLFTRNVLFKLNYRLYRNIVQFNFKKQTYLVLSIGIEFLIFLIHRNYCTHNNLLRQIIKVFF